MKELNAFAPEVVALATEPKRIRLFYSETAAIQDATYMDQLHESYRSLYHHGLPMGFVTGHMLREASEEQLQTWPVVLVPHANHITTDELKALSRYRSLKEGLVIVGTDCLNRDEYGRKHSIKLAGEGKLIRAGDLSDPVVKVSVAGMLRRNGQLPPVKLRESNAVGKPGCVWRTSPWGGGHLLLVINLGKTEAQLTVIGTPGKCHDMLTNSTQPKDFALGPFGVKLLYFHQSER